MERFTEFNYTKSKNLSFLSVTLMLTDLNKFGKYGNYLKTGPKRVEKHLTPECIVCKQNSLLRCFVKIFHTRGLTSGSHEILRTADPCDSEWKSVVSGCSSDPDINIPFTDKISAA